MFNSQRYLGKQDPDVRILWQRPPRQLHGAPHGTLIVLGDSLAETQLAGPVDTGRYS